MGQAISLLKGGAVILNKSSLYISRSLLHQFPILFPLSLYFCPSLSSACHSIFLSFSSSTFLSSVFLSVRSLSRHKTNTCNCYLENIMQTYRRRRDIFPLWSEILDGGGLWGRGPEVDLLNQNGRRFRLPYYLLC